MAFALGTVRYRPLGQRRRAPSLQTYLRVWRERRALSRLDAARLRDLGVTEAQAAKEAGRPIWDVSGVSGR